jgi:AcrR family transcriptional regulator
MNKNDIRARNKRAKILNSAIRLFKDQGIKKVTMDDIANLSNVSKMTVYKYFSDKESLYKYVGEDLLDRCRKNLEEHVNIDIDIVQKMIKYTSILITFITEDNLSLCINLGRLNEEVKRGLEQFNKRTRETIIDIIKEGKSRKLIYEDVSDDCIYHYIDMGFSYFQNNLEYREKIMSNPVFRQEFMLFIWKNVFIDHSSFTEKV